jgi:hypothetical protein
VRYSQSDSRESHENRQCRQPRVSPLTIPYPLSPSLLLKHPFILHDIRVALGFFDVGSEFFVA